MKGFGYVCHVSLLQGKSIDPCLFSDKKNKQVTSHGCAFSHTPTNRCEEKKKKKKSNGNEATYDMHKCIIRTHITSARSRVLCAHHIKHILVLLTNSCKCNLRENVWTRTQRGAVDEVTCALPEIIYLHLYNLISLSSPWQVDSIIQYNRIEKTALLTRKGFKSQAWSKFLVKY